MRISAPVFLDSVSVRYFTIKSWNLGVCANSKEMAGTRISTVILKRSILPIFLIILAIPADNPAAGEVNKKGYIKNGAWYNDTCDRIIL